MVQARYSFGLIGATLPVILNLATLGGYCVINALLGSQTLAAVSGRNLSPAYVLLLPTSSPCSRERTIFFLLTETSTLLPFPPPALAWSWSA